ncbi:hypothetical protein BaRGS_00025608, partial [Batillaria attramentaria]
STKSRKLIKFSPRLRKKSRSRENAVKDMEGGCSRDHSDHIPNGLNDKEKQAVSRFTEISEGQFSNDMNQGQTYGPQGLCSS